MSPAPYRRPVFDFDASLRAARELVDFSEELTGTMRGIADMRNVALGAWSGPWGDEFRQRAEEEGENIRTVAARLRGDADYWGMVWQQAAIQLNNVVYAEAVMEVKDWIAGEKDREERDREEALKDELGDVGGVVVEGAIDVGEAFVGFFTNVDPLGEALKRVPEPLPVGRPRLAGFVPGGSSFAHYRVYGGSASISHQGDPAPGGYVTQSEFNEADADSGQQAEQAVEEAEANQPDPVAVDASRPSLGADDGYCSIDLDLVDEYLACFAAGAAGPTVTSLDQSFNALNMTVDTAAGACQDYQVPDRGRQVMPLFFAFMAANVNAMTAVRVEVGQNQSGVITVANSDITLALQKHGLENAPGLIKITEPEFKGYPPNSGFTDDPICAATGNFVHSEQDLAMPGFADAISVERTYNASSAAIGFFGIGWSSVLDMQLFPGSGDDDSIPVTLADGAVVTFQPSDDGYHPHHARQLRLSRTDTGWQLRQGIDTDWYFDPSGLLIGGREEASTWGMERSSEAITVTEHLTGRSVRYELSAGGYVERAVTSDGRTATYRYTSGADHGALDGLHCAAVDRPTGGVSYEIDDNGRITALNDADGVLIARNSYDEWGRAIAQLSPFGRTSRYEYGELGTTRIFDDQGGPTNAMTHDARGNLTSMIGGDGRAQRMQWDALDRLSTVRDRKGLTTKYHYHPEPGRDLLVKTIRPDDSEEERLWDDQDRLSQVIDPGGGRHIFEYEGSSRYPASVQDPAGGITRFTRDQRGLPTSIVDPDEVVTHLEWDGDGQVVAITNGVGRQVRFSYSTAGELISVIGINGETSSFEVDAGGRVTNTIDPAGGIQSIEYSAAGRPLACNNGSGQVIWTIEYGDHGFPARMTDAEGATVEYGYDIFGNRTEIVAPDGDQYKFDYDTLGQLVKVHYGETGASIQEFDANGNIIAVTDPDGMTLVREVDRLDRTVRIVEPSGAETSYTYHPSGPIASVTKPDGSVFGYGVDLAGRVTSVTGPDGATVIFEYSAAGRLISRTTAEGRRTAFTYNEAGQPETITEPGGTVRRLADSEGGALIGEGDEFVSFELDDAGRVISWSNTASGAAGSLGWDNNTVSITAGDQTPALAELDRRGQVAKVTDPAGAVTEFEHDLRGRIGSITTGAQTTEYAYNVMGKVVSISDSADDVEQSVEIGYSPAGRMLSMHRGDETEIVCERDEAGRVSAIGTGDNGPALVTFEHDVSGFVTGATTASGTVRVLHDGYGVLRSVSDINGAETTYDRDRDGLLTAMVGNDGSSIDVLRSDAGQVIGYRSGDVNADEPGAPGSGANQRDTAGKITTDHLGRVHRYDQAGRLIESVDRSGLAYSFAYSDEGLLASDSSMLLGERSFAYNGRSQLVGLSDGDGTTTYGYDDRGRRTSERRSDGSTISYLWNALDQLIGVARRDGAGVETTRHFHYSGLGRVERIDDTAIGWDDVLTLKPVRIGDRRFFRSGMQVMEVGGDGQWRDGSTSDPFGFTGEQPGIDFGFRGELTVDGLVLMGDRVYDPRSRSFLTKDPEPAVLANPGAHNPYEYCYGDPINLVDPTGRRPISTEEFGDWKNQQTQSRVGAFTQAIVDDPWGSIALAVLVVGATALIITGVGAGVGAAILIGVAFSAAEGFATKSFSPTKTTIDGAISGLAAGIGGPIAGKVGGKVATKVGTHTTSRLAAWAPKAAQAATSGAVGGFIEGTGSTLSSQAFDQYGNATVDNLDPGEALKQGLTSSVTGAAGGLVGSAFQEGAELATGKTNSRLLDASVAGATDFTVSAGSGYIITGELDLVGAAKEGAIGFAGDLFEDKLLELDQSSQGGGDGTTTTRQADTDGDGIINTPDTDPTTTTRQADTDGDGIINTPDTDPTTTTRQADTDGDGIINTPDTDPTTTTRQADTDGDGIDPVSNDVDVDTDLGPGERAEGSNAPEVDVDAPDISEISNGEIDTTGDSDELLAAVPEVETAGEAPIAASTDGPNTDRPLTGTGPNEGPYNDQQLATADSRGVDPSYVNPDGRLQYPDAASGFPNGADGGEVSIEITAGDGPLIRYGDETGNFLAPEGTEFSELAMPANNYAGDPTTSDAHTYEVVEGQSFEAEIGIVAPWFDEPGGGLQIRLPDDGSVGDLLRDGVIREVPNSVDATQEST